MSDKEERTLISFDWALKSILRQKDNFDILEGFLADLLGYDIKITGLLESESNKDSDKDKFNRVDLKAIDGGGREIIIEVQHNREPDYLERVYYGTSKSLIDNMKEGYRYGRVKKIISVSIVYWKFLEKSYIIKGSMKFEDMVNRGGEIRNAKDIFAEYYFIQPEWFEDKIRCKLDEWVYLFKHSKVKGEIGATNISRVQEKLDRLRMTDSERRAYEDYQFNKAINDGVMQVKMEEGEQIGMQKGIEKGIEKGMREGEKKAKEKMIEAMKESGMADKEIEKVLELSEKN